MERTISDMKTDKKQTGKKLSKGLGDLPGQTRSWEDIRREKGAPEKPAGPGLVDGSVDVTGGPARRDVGEFTKNEDFSKDRIEQATRDLDTGGQT